MPRVLVSNLPPATSEAEIRSLFESSGTITGRPHTTSPPVALEPAPASHTATASVDFEAPGAVDQALALHQTIVGNRQIRVVAADGKPVTLAALRKHRTPGAL